MPTAEQPLPGDACLVRVCHLCRYPLKLAGFWTAQSLWGWIVLLPVTVSQVRGVCSKGHGGP